VFGAGNSGERSSLYPFHDSGARKTENFPLLKRSEQCTAVHDLHVSLVIHDREADVNIVRIKTRKRAMQVAICLENVSPLI
jgi:hypothetical protein